PVVGTLLVIAAGRSASLNRWAPSLAPVVWIGLISYPLYLFHWPLISFVHVIRGATPGRRAITIAVALAVGLAIASYYALERRIRHSKSPWTVPILVLCFLGLGGMGYGVWRGALPPRPGILKSQQNLDAAIAELKVINHLQGWPSNTISAGIFRHSIGGDGSQTLVVGDSHAAMVASRIHELIQDPGIGNRGAVLMVRAAVCPLPGIASPTQQFSENLIPSMMKEVSSNPAIDRVVIVAFWPHYFSECWKAKKGGDKYFINGVALNLPEGQEMALSALGVMVRQLVASGKKVTVVLTVPFGQELSPRSGYRRSFLGGFERTTQPLPVATFRRRHGLLNDAIATTARAGGADVIDPVESLQVNGVCIFEDENGPIRFDSNHLRAEFSRRHATYIDSVISP
ncbi:MAG: acyltransferase family protein, partial [Planctomycetota bacterium]